MAKINPVNIPPFSTLDSRSAKWKQRKAYWRKLGIKAPLSSKPIFHRAVAGDFVANKMASNHAISSSFDPVLTEVIYSWYTKPGYSILDPFAGGAVRGIIASKLSREYLGIDIWDEQVSENIYQLSIVEGESYKPKWIVGDSNNILSLVNHSFDFIFSCPPYYNLEQYSNNEGDLSNSPSWSEFVNSYRHIIKQSCSLLKPNRFAVFVVSDFRSNGTMLPLASETISAFEQGGMHYHDNLIHILPLGSLPFRMNSSMYATRKTGRHHQNILVFVKGDARIAAEDLNEDVQFYESRGKNKFRNVLKKIERLGYCKNSRAALLKAGATAHTLNIEREELKNFLIEQGISLLFVQYRYSNGNRSNPQEYFISDFGRLVQDLEQRGYRDIQLAESSQ